MKGVPRGPILRIKVTLRESSPPIWRRLLVPADMTLGEFHEVLQIAMGWTDTHLHHFTAKGVYYGTPDPEWDMDYRDERRVRLAALLKSPKDRLRYEYDFGDGWEHEVVVEEVLAADPSGRYPWVLAGKRACPPEDCGGIPGYFTLLAALADPAHPEHGELSDWVGENFDPEKFDAEEVNRVFHPE